MIFLVSMTVHTIPFGQPFIDTLAQGIVDRYGADPLQLGRTLVLLPTRRGCLSLKDAFLARGNKSPILPRIVALSDLEETPHLPGYIPEPLPPTMPMPQQLGLMTQLILAYGKGQGALGASTALGLARDLLTLIDEIHTSDVDLEKLNTLVGEAFAAHWQITLDFLKIITDYWPAILAENNCMDSATRKRENLRRLAQEWSPKHPVILAGTTATRPATADLARTIAALDQGHVVLPGYEPLEDILAHPTHPQFTLHTLVAHLGLGGSTIPLWCGDQPRSPRLKLMTQMMAPVIEHQATITNVDEKQSIINDLSLIPCASSEEEALAIACLIRQELDRNSNASIAIITPDQELTRRLEGQLERWDIVANTSGGTPLDKTVVGTFLLLVARCQPRMEVTEWLALLKHPLFWRHKDRGIHLTNVRQLDLQLRQLKGAKLFQESLVAEAVRPWYNEILQEIQPLLRLRGKQDLSTWITALLEVAESLCSADKLWLDSDGGTAQEALTEIFPHASLYPKLSVQQFANFLPQLLTQYRVHNRKGIGSPVRILGTLEARQNQADVVILGGLNEGTWPQGITDDPWLNRQMRLDLGLPDPQRRIALAAHDFCIGFSAKRVYLTRPQRSQGAIALPSRWWLRLEAALKANCIRLAPSPVAQWLTSLDRPKVPLSRPEPQPRPALDRRPNHYSVTDVEQLIRDPYTYYARKILRLRKLDPLTTQLDPRDFGILVHNSLDLYHQRHKNAIDLQSLMDCGKEVFGDLLEDPIVQSFWWPRFVQIAEWLVDQWSKDTPRSSFTELPGRLQMNLPQGPVELATIADRLDILEDNQVRIIDYKTGQPPTQKDVKLGLSPQLTLEALILNHNGFKQIKDHHATNLQYWHLKGGAEGGTVSQMREVDNLATAAHEGLAWLLSHFQSPESVYISCPWGEARVKGTNYLHLARLEEWQP